MATENFTAYTEVDAGDDITVTATKCDVSSMNKNVNSYVAYDEGVDHFDGNFEHLIEMYVSDHTGNATVVFWMLANVLNNAGAIYSAGGSFYVARTEFWSANYYISLSVLDEGAWQNAGYTCSANTLYYCNPEFDKDVGTYGTVYLRIYSDAARTNLLSTLSKAVAGSKKVYRFVYCCSSWYDGVSTVDLTCYCQNLDLQEGGAVYELSLSDGTIGTDTPSAIAIFGASVSEGGVGADTPSSIAIFEISNSEGGIGGDSPLAIATLGLSIADGGVGGDAPTIRTIYEVSLAEGGIGADTPSSIRTMNLTLSDGAVVSDSISANCILDIAVADGGVAGDTALAIMEMLASISDGAIGADSVTTTEEGVVLYFTGKDRTYYIVAHDKNYRWDAKSRVFRNIHNS
uniref:Uncharacterized protein n=1 Tax=viral metagenome TaxID=1070528 RepID=A0A6M3M116_9ZZZZ